MINYLHAWRPNVDVRERESSVLIHVHTVPLMCIKYVYIIYIYILPSRMVRYRKTLVIASLFPAGVAGSDTSLPPICLAVGLAMPLPM